MPHLAKLGMSIGGQDGVEHRLDVLLTLVRRMGYADIEARMLSDRKLLMSSVSCIAIAGPVGTGKSTLINQGFLAEGLLPMDAATAVPTEIRHGPERRMEIVPYLGHPRPPVPPGGKATGIYTTLSACEGPPTAITDPTPADIRRHTSAVTPAERKRLSGTTARVRIFLPSPMLERRILVDTPGIGPMDRAAFTTRYRILPDCDRIFFTAHNGNLSAAERAFLKSPVFEGCDVRLLPPGAAWPTREGAWRPISDGVPADRSGRTERELTRQAALALARCSAELRAGAKSTGERRRIESDISAMEATIRIRQVRMLADLNGELAVLEAHISDTATREVNTAIARYAEGRSGMATLPKIAWEPLSRHLESAMADRTKQVMAAVQSLAERYASEGLKLLETWDALVRRELGAGAVPAIHAPFSMRAMDMIALARFNPFGILADILPGIVAPAPSGPAGSDHWLRMIQRDMPHRVEGIFRPITEMLPAEWDDDMNNRMAAVRQGISAPDRPVDPDRRALLEEALPALERFTRPVSTRWGATGKTPNRSVL